MFYVLTCKTRVQNNCAELPLQYYRTHLSNLSCRLQQSRTLFSRHVILVLIKFVNRRRVVTANKQIKHFRRPRVLSGTVMQSRKNNNISPPYPPSAGVTAAAERSLSLGPKPNVENIYKKTKIKKSFGKNK